MIPRMDITALATAGALGSGVIPLLPMGHYVQGNAAVSAALLVFMAQDMDRGAQRRLAEISRMAELFVAASGVVPGELAGRLSMLAATPLPPPSLAALDGHRGPMLEGLIALHVALEAADTPEARALEERLLDHLRQSADAKALVIPPQG